MSSVSRGTEPTRAWTAWHGAAPDLISERLEVETFCEIGLSTFEVDWTIWSHSDGWRTSEEAHCLWKQNGRPLRSNLSDSASSSTPSRWTASGRKRKVHTGQRVQKKAARLDATRRFFAHRCNITSSAPPQAVTGKVQEPPASHVWSLNRTFQARRRKANVAIFG
ncbi:unnamed protein product [Caenorhabditis auriculariae]|uniref:Uncharacterized protein n=1 Tax=Caenorhabditis auriculariae TaxID=2777116 RepID=A0A8S1GR68_9PELO|nr:unnamed protein product [Caenorhabditis auriculariae]